MKIGCCINMMATPQDVTGSDRLALIGRLGYDYAEIPLAQTMELDAGGFERLLARLDQAGLPCECCNNFFPAAVRITGPEASPDKIAQYAQAAVKRAERLGAEIIVFGSSGAKNVPQGFPMDKAFDQIVDALKLAAPICQAHGITIAIEPLNCGESNIILNLDDGLRLMDAVSHPAVKLLVDFYHFTLEKEELSTLSRAMPHLAHAHFANPEGRRIPVQRLPVYEAFLDTLRSSGYPGRLSVEAYTDAPEKELAQSLGWLKQLQK